MRAYQLYLIEDEFASYYFGREQILFQLFLDKESTDHHLKSIIEQQIQYITKPISRMRIDQLIQIKLAKNKGFRCENGVYYLESKKTSSRAKLQIFEHVALLESSGSLDAETRFFEALRQCENSFLAIDPVNQRYGWLNPIKERKFV